MEDLLPAVKSKDLTVQLRMKVDLLNRLFVSENISDHYPDQNTIEIFNDTSSKVDELLSIFRDLSKSNTSTTKTDLNKEEQNEASCSVMNSPDASEKKKKKKRKRKNSDYDVNLFHPVFGYAGTPYADSPEEEESE